MGLRDILKDVGAVAGIVGETRRVANFISNTVQPKKDLKKENDALKQELRHEQMRRQEIEQAIRNHKKEMEEESYPRRFECDLKLWKIGEDSFAPNGKLSDHPIAK